MKMTLALLGVVVLASSSPQADAAPRREDKTDVAIRRAVGFLITQQDKDGAIQAQFQWANRTAMTALSIMAMAAVGHQPADDTPQGHAMKRALAFVLKPENQDAQGYFGGTDGSR